MSFFLFFLASAFLVGATTDAPKKLHNIPLVESKIKIDGVLDDEGWNQALKLTLNYEVEPGENIAPPVKTEVFLAYSEKYLYVGFKAYDPDPSRIRARVTDRDNIGNDDYVGIAVDTFNDSRLAFNFFCNPYGIQFDQMFTLSQGATNWDSIWDSAGHINKEGYCVEMAIPFTSMRFQAKKGEQTWGIDAVRVYPRSLVHTIGLFPRDRNNNCYMCQADKAVGFSGAKPGKNLEFDPTLSGILSRERVSFPNGKYETTDKKIEPGLTARWSFTPNMALNVAINPDFSQIEADAAQLNVNNQFALFYPEKRPFFLEGSNIFQGRFYAVYTRTVADPEWGVKITGKEKKHALGFFVARDRITNLILPTSENSSVVSLNMKNTSTALRYLYDVGRASNVGIFLTNREGENNYYSRLAGIDGDIRPIRTERFAFQYLISQTRYPDVIPQNYDQPKGRFNGGAIDFYYSHATRKEFIYGHYQGVTPNFRADVGFADQTGTKMYDAGIRKIWRKNPGFWYSNINLTMIGLLLNDYDNRLLLKSLQFNLNYNGPLQSVGIFVYNLGKRTYLGREFTNNYFTFNVHLRPSASLLAGFMGTFGDQVDFTNIRQGTRVRLNPGFEYNAGRHLFLGVDHVYEKLNVQGGRLYVANLTNLSVVYQFDRRAFFRTILQYADYDYNSALYLRSRNPKFNHLFTQLLFSYKLNPQTVLFLGYSDDYYGYNLIPLKQNNYTFFMKIGYALVL